MRPKIPVLSFVTIRAVASNKPFVTKGSIEMTLQDLSDTQLLRLYRKLYRRIEVAFAGGLSFGVDMPTLWAVWPGMAATVVSVLRENGRRRGL